MKIKFIALSLCLIASANVVKGQDNGKKFTPSTNKHEIRISASDKLSPEDCQMHSRAAKKLTKKVHLAMVSDIDMPSTASGWALTWCSHKLPAN